MKGKTRENTKLNITNAGTAVGIAGDPGTVDSEHHEQQQHNKDNNHPQVHSKIISLALKHWNS